MKVLLWMLIFILMCAAQDSSTELGPREMVGSWNTIYLASNNKEKISEDGPLRFYIRNIKASGNDVLHFSFYLRVNDICQNFTLRGMKRDNVWFTLWYSGKIYLQALPMYHDMSVIFLANISEDGFVTSLLMALSTEDDLSPEEYEYFETKTKEMVIPVKNIIKIAGTDVCPQDDE